MSPLVSLISRPIRHYTIAHFVNQHPHLPGTKRKINHPTPFQKPSLTPPTIDSLTTALRHHDAVISAQNHVANAAQLLLVEAAALAGIKRFIPSEFGIDTLHPRASTLPSVAPKVEIQEALKKQARESGMSYTLICTGPFLDWGLQVGFIMDVKGRKAELFDGGERLFSATSLKSIGQAVVGVLRNLEETENRAVYVQDAALTLKGLLEMAKKAGGEQGWVVEEVDTTEVVRKAWEELRKEKPDPEGFVFQFIKAAIWGEGYGGLFERLDNELLGIKGMGEGEVQELVKSFV